MRRNLNDSTPPGAATGVAKKFVESLYQIRTLTNRVPQQGFNPCYSKDRTQRGMAKVTSKYQVTVPKAIADKYRIRPGDDIDWVAAGDVIRVVPATAQAPANDRESRLHWFDQATERHRRRREKAIPQSKAPRDRGWRREDLYARGGSR